jgi:hypothetical protein
MVYKGFFEHREAIMRWYGNSAYAILFVSTVLAGFVASRLLAAPAGPTQHHGSLGDSGVIATTSTLLFGGAVPPNGFMAQINGTAGTGQCRVNDNGPAGPNGHGIGGFAFGGIPPALFITPPGYKPIGPVSVWCDAPVTVEARGW